MTRRAALIPCLRYRDALAAIEFLCQGFGFSRHQVYLDDNDPSIVHHAELVLGDSMVMLSSAVDNEANALYRWKTPAEAGGVTVCICLIVDDPDSHCARAEAAGAEIVTPPHDNVGYPGRSYNCRDPEGNNLDIGTYDPWAS